MADQLKVLGQSSLTANFLTNIYTVPAATQAIVRAVTFCNTSATPTTFRLSVAPAGVADNARHYLYWDVPLGGNETFAAELAIAMATTDILRALAGAAGVSVGAFGLEIT